VVNLEYEGGTTASFTITAFTDFAFRQTKIFGTHGCLEGNGREVEVLNFRTGNPSGTSSKAPASMTSTPAATPASFEPSLRPSSPAGPRTSSQLMRRAWPHPVVTGNRRQSQVTGRSSRKRKGYRDQRKSVGAHTGMPAGGHPASGNGLSR
jgi:hypothetical protein